MKKTAISMGILAGGKSTRMGQDKALLTLNGRHFLDIIAQELSTLGEVLVSVDEKAHYGELPYKTVEDVHKNIGPMEGLYQVISHADTPYVFVCAADMPFIEKELVSYMQEFISSDYDCYVMVDEDHIHPLCGIYSKAALPVIEELIAQGNYRLMAVLRALRTKYISLESSCFTAKVVRNINTREAYKGMVLPCIFCVSGWKDSGKTGLIERLINEFIKTGYSVGVIKHDGHDFTVDQEGTDSWRFSQAGAKCSMIFSDKHYAVMGQTPKNIEEMISYAKGVDIIILEGMKTSPYPKVEVIRQEVSQKSVCEKKSLICIATDMENLEEATCSVYGLDDIPGIFMSICKYFGLNDARMEEI